MIRVRDLSVRYPDHEALRSISLDVAAGECLVITGVSGCGKSTLARVLTGLIPQSIPATVRGEVKVGGLDVLHCRTSEVARQVGAVFQNPRMHLFHLRVEDEVAFGPRNLGLPAAETKDRVEWALEALGIAGLREQSPAELSGGQIQRVAIASALAMRPAVLVLDEPTASLDVPGTRNVIAALESLRLRYGLTIILVEHRLAEVRHLADRVLVMDEGRIAASGPFDEVLDDHQLLRRFGLRRPTEEPLRPWQELLIPNGHHPPGSEPVLSLQDLTTGYDGQPMLKDVNLDVFPGEFVALVGDNGAGKSTLALASAGLLKPQRGRVLVRGRSRSRPGLDIALLFQNPADQLFTDSVDEEVAFAARNYDRFNREVHEEILEKIDLLDLRSRRTMALSVGQQQRTALASCLELRPALVILDEPTLGQDWRHLQQLMELLLRLNLEGTAILLISHDYKLIHRYARRVVLLESGRVVLDGRLDRESRPLPVAEEPVHAES